MSHTVAAAVSALGVELKQKLAQPVVTGDPEDQLRTPLDTFHRSAAKALGSLTSTSSVANFRPEVLSTLESAYGRQPTAEEVIAYTVAVTSHPAYTTKFRRPNYPRRSGAVHGRCRAI